MSNPFNTVVTPLRVLFVTLLLVLLLVFRPTLPGFRLGIIAQPHILADGTSSPPTTGGPTPQPNPSVTDASLTGHGSTTGGTTVGGGTPPAPS